MDEQNKLLKTTARLVVATLVIVFMVIGKSFLIPLAWALLIGLSSYRFLNRVEEKTKIPRTLINSFFLLVLFLVLVGTGYFFFIEISHIFRDLPGLSETLSGRIHDISISIKKFGIYIPDHIDKLYFSDWVNNHTNMVMDFIKVIGVDIWNIILIMFYMFFLLYYRDPVNADLVLFPAAWTNTTIYYWYDYWCWYYPYYCGWGWGWGYPSVSSYTTGTLLMTLVADGDDYVEPFRVWSAAANGLLSGAYNTDRVLKTIDQAFEQSPYLNIN